MAFCSNCGKEVSDKAKFCANCGASIEGNRLSDEKNIVQNSTELETTNWRTLEPVMERKKKDTGTVKLSWMFGIVLLILAYVDYHSDPPVVTIFLSVVIIVCAVYCLIRKFKLRLFTVLALLLAVFCLNAGINQGKRLGFFKIPKASDYQNTQVVYSDQDVVDNKWSGKVQENSTSAKEEKGKIVADTTERNSDSGELEENMPTTEQAEVDENKEVEETKEIEESQEPEENKETEESQEPEETKKPQNKNEVDPELKAFLDSYEAYIDEYVVFMKKYLSDTGNALTMLSEYLVMMQKYEEFAEKIDEYDEKEMSSADEKYYLEVVSRCTIKMAEIY